MVPGTPQERKHAEIIRRAAISTLLASPRSRVRSEITLCCKLLKHGQKFGGWVSGTISATGCGWAWRPAKRE